MTVLFKSERDRIEFLYGAQFTDEEVFLYHNNMYICDKLAKERGGHGLLSINGCNKYIDITKPFLALKNLTKK